MAPPPLTKRGEFIVGLLIGWALSVFLIGLVLVGSRLTGGH